MTPTQQPANAAMTEVENRAAILKAFPSAHTGNRLSDGKVYAEVKLKNDEKGNSLAWQMQWTMDRLSEALSTRIRVTYYSTCANGGCVTMLIMFCVDEGKKSENQP